MVCRELEDLIAQYQAATSKDDKLFVMELCAIADILANCGPDEIYSKEIARKFTNLVRDLKYRVDIPWDPESLYYVEPENPQTACNNFLSYPREQPAYPDGEKLLCDFYNHFRNEKKKRMTDKAPVQEYPKIEKLDDLKTMQVNITLRDYVARVRTFTRLYLWDIPNAEKLRKQGNSDLILFTYENLELFLAVFNTKQENGEPDKQKVNIRSALRKLNEFKQYNER